jgi:hypothetical protein
VGQNRELIGATILGSIGAGLQLLGYTNSLLGSALWGFAAVLVLVWIIDWIARWLSRQRVHKGTAWAARDRLELFDIACLISDKPLGSPWQEPQRSRHKWLKDAVRERKTPCQRNAGDRSQLTYAGDAGRPSCIRGSY